MTSEVEKSETMILTLGLVLMLPLINGQFHTDRVNAVIHENGILWRSSNITFFHQIGRHKTGDIISFFFFFFFLGKFITFYMLFFNYIFAGIYTVRFRDLLENEPYVQLTTKYWGQNGTINFILHNNMRLITLFSSVFLHPTDLPILVRIVNINRRFLRIYVQDTSGKHINCRIYLTIYTN